MSFHDMSGFGQNAGLLIFVEPSQVADSQKWFVNCSLIMKRCRKNKGQELVKSIRYLWTIDEFNAEIRRDFTLEAMARLDDEGREAMHRALQEKHPDDQWVKVYFPKLSGVNTDASDNDAGPSTSNDTKNNDRLDSEAEPLIPPQEDGSSLSGSGLVTFPELKYQQSNPTGKYLKCYLCGFLCQKSSFIRRFVQGTVNFLYQRNQCCIACDYYTLQLKSTNTPAPAPGIIQNSNVNKGATMSNAVGGNDEHGDEPNEELEESGSSSSKGKECYSESSAFKPIWE